MRRRLAALITRVQMLSINCFDGYAQNWIKIWDSSTRKCPTSLGFLYSFLYFPFSLFPIFLRQWLIYYWTCFQFENIWERITDWDRQVLPWSRRKLFSQVFTQISEHFRVYLRFHWANHSDLGISAKICLTCFSCRTWVWMMSINIGQGRWCQKRYRGLLA